MMTAQDLSPSPFISSANNGSGTVWVFAGDAKTVPAWYNVGNASTAHGKAKLAKRKVYACMMRANFRKRNRVQPTEKMGQSDSLESR